MDITPERAKGRRWVGIRLISSVTHGSLTSWSSRFSDDPQEHRTREHEQLSHQANALASNRRFPITR